MPRAPQWCDGAIPKRITGNNIVVVSPEASILVHIIVVAGAAASRLDVYDQREGPVDTTKRIAAVIAAGSEDDGVTNMPVRCTDGIIAQFNVTDAEGWVYYIPMPPAD